MPRGIYKRKKKVGKPKGNRNKPNITILKTAIDDVLSGKSKWVHVGDIPTEPPSYLSRLEAATVKYEQAIDEAIEALKGQ